MDEFYQILRKVQKKERNNGSLARVDEDFYDNLVEYLDELKKEAIHNPFSKATSLLKQAQIISTEICERREKKIAEAAVINIHRSYHLFTGKPQFDLVDTTPLNLTPEEEKFYYSLIDTLRNHRGNISLEKMSDDEESPSQPIIKPKETQTNTLTPKPVEEEKTEVETIEKSTEQEPEEIKPVVEKPKPVVKPKVENIENNPNAVDDQDEFYDFESKKVAKETELVTMLVFDDVGAIVGVDERVYGPFRPQDIVTLPLVNAKIFFKNRKGRQVKI